MEKLAAGSNRDAQHLRASGARIFKHFTPDGVQLAIARVSAPTGEHSTLPTLLEDAFVVTIPLRTYEARVRRDSKVFAAFPFQKGVLAFHDLHMHWSGDFEDGFDFLHLHVPKASFAQFGHSSSAISNTALPTWGNSFDTVVDSLSAILQPAIRDESDAGALFVEHVTNALHAHIAHRYMKLTPETYDRRGLAPHHLAIAQEMLMSPAEPAATLADIARVCDISLTRLIRGFQRSAGLPPHRWLLEQRVAKARDLLVGQLQLAAVGDLCGFADQSHFTRVFTRIVGVGPGAWQKEFGMGAKAKPFKR